MAARNEKRTARAGKAAPRDSTPRIAISGTDNIPDYYANHVEVGQSIHEYEIVFAKLPTRMDEEQIDEIRSSGILKAEAICRVLIPPTLMADLIKVLQGQEQKMQENRAVFERLREASQ